MCHHILCGAFVREAIVEAKFLSDELRFMNETGDSLANRLEKLADRNRELVDLMENAGGIGVQSLNGVVPSHPVKLEGATQAEPFPAEMPSIQQKTTHQKTVQQEQNSLLEEDGGFEIDDFDLDAEIDGDDEFDFNALSDGAYRQEEAQHHKPQIDLEAKSKVRSFAIFDRDHLDEDDELDLPQDESPYPTDDSDDDGRKFHSRAEQDLYEALQRKKNHLDKVSES